MVCACWFCCVPCLVSTAPCIWQSLVRCSPVEYRILDFSGRILPDMPYSALLGSTVDTCLRQSTSSWFLLVAMHLALCSLACRPLVAGNGGSARLVLLVTKQLVLFSPFLWSGPRCATSWPVGTRRTENSPVAPHQAPCIWHTLVRCWSCLRCTGLWTLLGNDFWNGVCMQHSLVRQWIHIRRQSTGAFERISCVFHVTVNQDPEVDSRFAWKSRFPRAPCIWQSLPAVFTRPV